MSASTDEASEKHDQLHRSHLSDGAVASVSAEEADNNCDQLQRSHLSVRRGSTVGSMSAPRGKACERQMPDAIHRRASEKRDQLQRSHRGVREGSAVTSMSTSMEEASEKHDHRQRCHLSMPKGSEVASLSASMEEAASEKHDQRHHSHLSVRSWAVGSNVVSEGTSDAGNARDQLQRSHPSMGNGLAVPWNAVFYLEAIIKECDSFCEYVLHGDGVGPAYLMPQQAACFLMAAKRLADRVHIPDLRPDLDSESDEVDRDTRGVAARVAVVPTVTTSKVMSTPVEGAMFKCTDCHWDNTFREEMVLLCPCGGMVCFTCLEKHGVCRGCNGRGSDSRFRTRMCKFHVAGNCPFGHKCAFAHSRVELRARPGLHRSLQSRSADLYAGNRWSDQVLDQSWADASVESDEEFFSNFDASCFKDPADDI